MKKLIYHPLALVSAACAVLYFVSWVTDSIQDNLRHLVVLPADPHPGELIASDVSPNLKKLALLQANAKPAAPAEGSEVIDLNAAFVPQAAMSTEPVVPDYFKALTENKSRLLKLQATTDDGAIINGRFIAFGDAIAAVAYPIGNGPKLTAPRLKSSKTSGTVLIQEPNGRRSFSLPQ